MTRSYWIAPAAALAVALLFATPAKADGWGFSVRLSHAGRHSYRRAPRVTYRRSHCRGEYRRGYDDDYYDDDYHSGRDVYRSGHGRVYYHHGRYDRYSYGYGRRGHYRGRRSYRR